MRKLEAEEIEARAEKVQRRTERKVRLFAVIFLLWQISYFVIFPDPGGVLRTVDLVRTVAFLAWVTALLALFATGGAMWRRGRLRDYLNDERAVALRAAACRAGFWTMTGLCFIGYAAALAFELRAVDVVHLILSGGVLAVLVTQAVLDRS